MKFIIHRLEHIFTSLAKEVTFLIAWVCLFVCLFVCYQHYSKSYEGIAMKFYGAVRGGKRNKWLDFGSDPDTHLVYKRILLNFWKFVVKMVQPSCMGTLWLFKNSIQQFESTSPKPVASRVQPSCMETLWLFKNKVQHIKWVSAHLLVGFTNWNLLTLQIGKPGNMRVMIYWKALMPTHSSNC